MTAGADKTQKSVQNTILAVAMLTNFNMPFASTALNIAVPHIGKEFHATATELTWIVLSFIMVTALLSVPFGKVADMYSREKLLKTGILLFFVSAVLNIFAPTMAVFLAFRALQGLGGAMVFATNIAIAVDAFPAGRRGFVLGLVTAAVYVGATCGPVIGGLITHAFGWRGVFVLMAALAITAFVAALWKLPRESKKEITIKLNRTSILLYIVSLGLLLYGLTTLTQNLMSYIFFAAGIVLVVIFIKHEARAEAALIEIRLFKGNREFSLSTLASLFNYASIFAITYFISIYLQLVKGFSADVSGLIMICQPIVQSVLSPISGRLSDRKSPGIIASFGMACCACALVMFARLGEGSSLFYIMAGLILTGVGVSFFTSPNSNVIMGSVSREDYGMASSVLSTARTVGQAIGMALLTIIINVVIGNVPIASVEPALIVRDMNISFTVFACICVVGIFFSLQRTKRPAPAAGMPEGGR